MESNLDMGSVMVTGEKWHFHDIQLSLSDPGREAGLMGSKSVRNDIGRLSGWESPPSWATAVMRATITSVKWELNRQGGNGGGKKRRSGSRTCDVSPMMNLMIG